MDNVGAQGKIEKSAEYLFLHALFDCLNVIKIKYCVLRNYESLPYSTNGSDIDILIEASQIKIFIDTLHLTAKKYSGHPIVYYRSGDFFRFCYCNPDSDAGWGIQFDIHTDESYRGLPYYDKDILLSRLEQHNNIPVLNKNDAMILALLKESLSNGISRKGYLKKAEISYKANPAHYQEMFAKYFGRMVANSWDLFLTNKTDDFNLKSLSTVTRRAVLSKAFSNDPVNAIKRKVTYQLDRFHRIINPIGFSVVFLGTDGSGKTTIISKITPLLESALHTKLNYEHMRPNLLPSIAQLLGKKGDAGDDFVSNPHESAPSGILGSFARLLYYSLDYIFGYWFKVYPQMIKRPCLFIFDRYFYDYLVDPLRGRIALSKKIINLMGAIIPEPDLIICLGADPEIIHKRKPELPLAETKRQVHELKKFSSNKKNAVWVDTGVDIDTSANEVLELLTHQMSVRYKGIL